MAPLLQLACGVQTGVGRAVWGRSQELLGFCGSRGLIGESRGVLLGLHWASDVCLGAQLQWALLPGSGWDFPSGRKAGVSESEPISGSE